MSKLQPNAAGAYFTGGFLVEVLAIRVERGKFAYFPIEP